MPRIASVWTSLVVLSVASCHRGGPTAGAAADAMLPPLGGYAAQRLIVTPTAVVRSADSLGWVQQLSGARSVARRLDTALVSVIEARGLASRWILPAELARAYERNRTYAPDPYQLAVDQLRMSKFKSGERYGEPLSSQLRTMIALHEDARFVLVLVELRFERAGAGGAAVLRVALLDPRFAEARWVGEVKGDAETTAVLSIAAVAKRLVDLFVAP